MRPCGAGQGCGWLLAVSAAATVLINGAFVAAADETPAAPVTKSVEELFGALAPAVVRVRLIGEELDAEGKNIVWIVTGFFISPEGRILTSLFDSTRIQRAVVEKDGLEYAGQFLGGDLRTKLALVQVLKMPENFAVIPLDPAPEPPAIGTPILAIVHPFQFEVSPSPGWITGYESAYAQYIFPCTYMRTNIPLGPGESGAPALDMQGQLVAVLVNDVPNFRASYAVTLSSIRRVVQDLNKAPGRVNYATLPVEFAEMPDKPYVARQVVVAQVQPDSIAARAGLRPGDVLLRLALVTDRQVELPASVRTIGDAPIRRMSNVRDLLFHALPGEFIRIEIERDGKAIPFFTLPVEALRDDATSEPAIPAASKPG